MKKIIVFTAFCGMASLGFGQGGLHDDKYEVTGSWQSNIADMDKPAMETPGVNNKVDTKGITYEEKDIKAETEYEPLGAKVPKPPKPQMDKLHNNFLKVGYGRFASPLAKLYMNTGRNLNGQVGLDFSHVSSSKGYVDYAEFRDTEGGVKAEGYVNNHTLGAKLRPQNSNDFYFADTIVEGQPDFKDSIRETFTRLDIEASLARNFDPDAVNYDVALGVQGLFDNHKKIDKGRDIHVGIVPNLHWKITDQFFADIASNLTFSNTEFDSIQETRFFLGFTPSVTFKLDRFRVQGGIQINSLTDSTTHFGAYPLLNASYDLIEAGILPANRNSSGCD
ncbi:MAG: hypothetical protein AAF570_02765 [Bacteroidota bacterium]